MNRWLLFVLSLVSLGGCTSEAAVPDIGQVVASSSDETAERDAIYAQVKAAIASDDFAALSAMEEDFRSSRARTPSGTWKLAAYHAALQADLAEGIGPSFGCTYKKADFVKRWAAAEPRNPAPFITDAAMLLQQAWCIRGPGMADEVAPDAWPRFRAGIDAAFTLLQKHRGMASVDPEYYTVLVYMLGSQGGEKGLMRNLLDEATAREPDYHRTYFKAVWFHMPQWGGSYAEVEQFARYAAERSRRAEGDGMYARVFWSLAECECDIVTQIADRTLLKQAMADVFQRYPAHWNGRYFADLSCQLGDREEGRRYLKAINPGATDEASMAALYAACDAMRRGAG
ncbi:MAG: hypothetical protein DI623_10245 [Sphingomonas sanxanigenens]|uniref:DUF4034 domain-containing protein n=1 Tax=Sphingomonas sanxanigenens TaxID=397260 RepID=A0A2W5A7V2_9SPHN|nr:MAG: hypothetical protein DI623_10245 [Sphingomonas sanxanigenens]